MMVIVFQFAIIRKIRLATIPGLEGKHTMSADNLAHILDGLAETSVYVIEEASHRLLYCNQRCRDTGRGRAMPGVECRTVWPEACSHCPLDALGEGSSSHMVCYDPVLKATVDITANRTLWDDHIPAVVITATPHRPNFEEEQGSEKFRQLYAQSLVTVFDECVIVNLTVDYYVNCHKDALWTDIPEQGNFNAENINYAHRVLHPDDVDVFIENFSREAMLRQFGEGKKQISRRLRRMSGDGSYHMAEFAAARLMQTDDDQCWCVLIFRDIQDEYLLEQQRDVEISQLATAARSAYQMLISVNLTQNTYHMLEYQRFPVPKPGVEGCFNDLIERELATVHPDHQDEFQRKFSRQALIAAFSSGEPIVAMKVPHKGEDGEYHWNFTQVVRVESPHTDDLIEITLSRNIDEERRLEEARLEKERQAKTLLEDALQKAEKASRAKSDFLSRMSHDIRTPMNAIVGMTELARRHIRDEARLHDYLEKIASSGAHLLKLVNEVLDVGKIESGVMKLEEAEFNLHDLVRETVEMVRLPLESKRQTLAVHIDAGLYPLVRGDARRLKQVLTNILENASKYTGEEGDISFRVEESPGKDQAEGAYRFAIEDTGIGMKPEYLRHIFEPFSRADDSLTGNIPGTGLGMTIVKNLVSLMGGTIQVESEYGRGSRFSVTLCLTRSHTPPAATPVEKLRAEATFSDLRVLLVEDNAFNRQIATEMLNLLGATVEVAEDGQQAVEAVRAHPPAYYDIVFMDIQMPVLNGYDAARTIRHSGQEGADSLPIIAMTADAFVEDVRRARLSGMNGHLAKPISIDQLKKVLIDNQVRRAAL